MAGLYTTPFRKTLFASLTQELKSRPIQRLTAASISYSRCLSRHQSTTLSSSQLDPTPPPPISSPSTTKHPQTTLTPTLLASLPLLNLQSSHPDGVDMYATLHIHGRPYLVTLGDHVRLPFRMPNVQPGDILRLTHASTFGTRDYTFRGAPWVDERLFEVRATVAGVESEPMRMMKKTKQRNRKVKTVKSKHRYTELLITQLKFRSMEELDEAGVASELFAEVERRTNEQKSLEGS